MSKREYKLKCKICNQEFKSFTTRTMYCDDCKTIKIICVQCGIIKEIARKAFNRNTSGKHFCSNLCQLKYLHAEKSGPGNCSKCGKFNNKRSSAGIGKECGCLNKHLQNDNNNIQKLRNNKALELNMSPGKCKLCGNFNEERNIYGIGINCGCHKIKQKEHIMSLDKIYERDNTGRIISINDIPWNEYIKDFQIRKSIDFKELGFQRINFDNSKLKDGYPTLAWQQLFTDICPKDKPYIVYIKYFINEKGESKQLQVGYTANNNINNSGTDINFIYDLNKKLKDLLSNFSKKLI